jgi:glycosyltransferase involved in cell wall biosynthesis
MGSNLPLKILYVVPYVPSRIRTRPFHLIKALASEGHRITLAAPWSNRGEFAAFQELVGPESILAERIKFTRSLWNCVCALPSAHPFQASYSWCPQLAKRITGTLETEDFDVIHVEHLRGVRYALLLNETLKASGLKRTQLVWDSVDCISALFRHAAQESSTFRSRLAARLELARTEQLEGWLTTQFSQILLTSESDRCELLKLAANWHQRNGNGTAGLSASRITVVPNGVDLEYFSPSGEAREPLTLVISGKMSYHANVTAVLRFVQEIMPKIWAELPETRLWIVGKTPSRAIQKLGISWKEGHSLGISRNGNRESRIQITGTVADIRPFLRRATVAVAPIRYGVGIQNKVLEAMACGTPVVATPQAASALQVESGRDLIIAENQQGLADSIIFLLKNPERRLRLGLSGRMYVQRQHEWRSIARSLTEIYRDASCQA